MQKKLTVAMDITDTLLDKKGKLDKNVFALFLKADLARTNFIFISGNSFNIANECVKQVNDILPDDQKVNGYIVTNCGSRIYDINGKLLEDNPMPKNFAKDIFDVSKMVDKKSVMMYCSNEKSFVEKQPKLSKTGIAFYFYRKRERKKKNAGINFIDIPQNDKKILTKPLHNIFVVSLNHKLKPVLLNNQQAVANYYNTKKVEKQDENEAIVGHFKNKKTETKSDFHIYNAFAIQVPAKTKEYSIKRILELDKSGNSPTDISEVICFGDSLTDAEMLRQSNISFARGKKVDRIIKEVTKYHYINLDKVADALYGNEDGFDERLNSLPKTDVFETSFFHR